MGVTRASAASTFDLVRDLPLRVDSASSEPLELVVSTGGFVRVTTVVRLHGAGEQGGRQDQGNHSQAAHWNLLRVGPIRCGNATAFPRPPINGGSEGILSEESEFSFFHFDVRLDSFSLRYAGSRRI